MFTQGQTQNKKNILFMNYALLAGTKHEQWHLKHTRAHTHRHAYTCARSYRSPPTPTPPHSQICLLLLSKPAVKSSIICIQHIYTAASLLYSLSLSFPLPPSPTRRHKQTPPRLGKNTLPHFFFFLSRWPADHISCTRAHLSKGILVTCYERHCFVLRQRTE